MIILEHIIAFFAPHICIGCGSEGDLLCNKCMQLLPRNAVRCYRCTNFSPAGATCELCRPHTSLADVWPATVYAGVAKELITSIKFNRASAAAETIARAVAGAIPVRKDIILTHAPTVPARARQRGYDQAQLIARHTSRLLGVPYAVLLARQGTQRQVGQSRIIRRQQMISAFRLLPGQYTRGKHIIVIDDVMTTGSTLEAAACVLRQAGAERVSAAVFAAA
jgi:ComF family protein